MAEKVIVTREVAEMIDFLSETRWPAKIIDGVYTGDELCCKLYDIIGMDDLIRALYVGFNVEDGPEMELAGYIAMQKEDMVSPRFDREEQLIAQGAYHGAKHAAELLGVELPVTGKPRVVPIEQLTEVDRKVGEIFDDMTKDELVDLLESSGFRVEERKSITETDSALIGPYRKGRRK